MTRAPDFIDCFASLPRLLDELPLSERLPTCAETWALLCEWTLSGALRKRVRRGVGAAAPERRVVVNAAFRYIDRRALAGWLCVRLSRDECWLVDYVMKNTKGFRRFTIKGGDKQVKKYIEDLRAQIVQAVNPQKIILFGSYAYGQPNENSDVDLLVVMPFEGSPLQQAFKLRLQMKTPHALDLLVRTSEQLAERLEMGDSFIRELLEHGKVLYEADYTGVDREGGRGLDKRATVGARP